MYLIQNTYGSCLGEFGPFGGNYGLNYAGISPAAAAGLAGPYGLGAGLAASPFGLSTAAIELGAPGPYGLSPAAIDVAGAYGGAGIGDVVVVGEMPVAGTTLVAGQVPILGAVRFAGDLPAAGTVCITGSCGCGCNAGYLY
ncbi:unnamed protein product, partial [Brenthis ino]